MLPTALRQIYLLLSLCLSIGFIAPAWSGIYNYRLNADSKALADINDFSLSPDGNWLFSHWAGEFYSIATNGGKSIKLVPAAPPNYRESYLPPQISPDSKTVIFIRSTYTSPSDHHYDLYSVPMSGGSVTTLTTKLKDEKTQYYSISPDGKRVVYVSATDELWSVPIGGGASVRLVRLLSSEFAISPDSQWVIFLQPTAAGGTTLYRIPLGGGTPLRLIPSSAEDSDDCKKFWITPDSKQIVYFFKSFGEMRCVAMAGGVPTVLDANPQYGYSSEDRLIISPDSRHVVYMKNYKIVYVTSYDWRGIPHTFPYNLWEIYSVSLAGGGPIRLNPLLTGTGTVENDFAFTPDGMRVLFRAHLTNYQMLANLYSVPIEGGTAAALTKSGGGTDSFQVSPNGLKTVYLEKELTSATHFTIKLFSVPTTGGIPVKLFERVIPWDVFNYSTTDYRVGAGGTRVILNFCLSELLSIPIDGGQAIRIDEPSTHNPYETLKQWTLGPDGQTVFMLGDLEDSSVNQIYRNASTGGRATRLNEAVYVPYDVESFLVSPNGHWVTYKGATEKHDVKELFCVPVTGGTPVRLAPGIGLALYDIYQISPDNRRVVFAPGNFLFSAPIQGGALVQLYPPPPPPGISYAVGQFQITPDSSRVVYVAGQWEPSISDCRPALYSSPIAGGTAVKLAECPISGSSSIPSFAITPDGRRVVYVMKDGDKTFIYSIATTGGTSVQLASFGDELYPFIAIAPDSQTVVYRYNTADGYIRLASSPVGGGLAAKLFEVSNYSNSFISLGFSSISNKFVFCQEKDIGSYKYVIDLFSVPASGGVPTKLNAKAISLIKAQQCELTPDGQRVVYMADQMTTNTVELFTVPVDGGASVRISRPLPLNTNVSEYQVSPDGRYVAYILQEKGSTTRRELFLTAADGSFTVKLDSINNIWGYFYRINSKGKTVTYVSDSNLDRAAELYSIPIQGSRRTPLNGNLHGLGVRGDFWTNDDGSLTIYCADQGTGGIHLFATTFTNSVDLKCLGLYQ